MELQTTEQQSLTDILPSEVIRNILENLVDEPLECVLNYGLVCKMFNKILYSLAYNRGVLALEWFHDNQLAIKEFKKSLRLNPFDSNSFYKLATVYHRENEDETSIKILVCALKYDQPGSNKQLLLARRFQIENHYKLAVQEVSKLIDSDPHSDVIGEAYYLRGFTKYDLADYEGAITDLTICLQFFPWRHLVYNCRGWCWKALGEREKAIEDFHVASRINPRYTKSFVNKAAVLSTRKQTSKIQEDIQFLTEFVQENKNEPHLGTVYFTLALIKQTARQWSSALDDYNNCIRFKFHSPHKAYVGIGWCYERLAKYKEAQYYYDYTLSLMPNCSAALEHKAAVLCRLNNHEEAIKQCQNAIKANPKPLSFSFRYLAAVEADRHNYAKAITILNNGLCHNKFDLEMYLNRGCYFLCDKRMDDALKDYETVIQHYPDTYEAWELRGVILFSQKKYEQAVVSFQKALVYEESSVTALNNLALTFMAIGKEKISDCVSLLQKAQNETEKVTSCWKADVDKNRTLLTMILTNASMSEGQSIPSFLLHPIMAKQIGTLFDTQVREIWQGLTSTTMV